MKLLLAVVFPALLATPLAQAQYTFAIRAESASPIFKSFGPFAPSLNATGTAAFLANLDSGDVGIFTANGGTVTTIALGSSPVFLGLGFPSINASGTVSFQAVLDSGGVGIFVGSGGATTTIAQSSDPTFSSFLDPAINAAGTVAFAANLDAGGSGVFTAASGTTTTIALSSGPIFSSFSRPSINAAGMVAFLANLDAGGSGIYLGSGTRVIGTGDALNGSTVTSLAFGTGGLNDLGQLAFNFGLANGSSGIAVATVPESSSALLLLLGSGAMLLRRRRALA